MGISPLTFTVTGSNFTANGGVSIHVLNSSGTIVGTTSVSAGSTGSISASIDSSIILSIGSNTPGVYNGSIVAVDQFTTTASNSIAIVLTVSAPAVPTISLSNSNFTYS